MDYILIILLVIFIFTTVYFWRKNAKNNHEIVPLSDKEDEKKEGTDDFYSSMFTVVHDPDLRIVNMYNIHNKGALTHMVDSVIGVNVRDLPNVTTSDGKYAATLIANNVVCAKQNKKSLYFEYSLKDVNGEDANTMCFVIYKPDGYIYCHYMRLGSKEVFKGRSMYMENMINNSINSISCGVYSRVFNAGEKEYILFNNAIKKLYGTDDILSSKFWNQMQEDAEDQIVSNSDEPLVFSREIKDTATGNYKYLEITKCRHIDPMERVCIFSTVNDVTQKKEDMEKIEDMAYRQNLLYNSIPSGVAYYDNDGFLNNINDRIVELFGLKDKHSVFEKKMSILNFNFIAIQDAKRALAGEKLSIYLEYDFDYIRRENLYDTTRTGIVNFEVRTTPLYDNNGQKKGLVVIFTDISDITDMKEHYLQMYKQSMAVFRAMPVGVSIYDKDGNLMYLNDAAVNIYGIRDKNKFITLKLNLFSKSFFSADEIDNMQNGESMIKSFDYDQMIMKNIEGVYIKHTKKINLVTCPVFSDSGDVQFHVLISSDITETQKQREELEVSRQNLLLAMEAGGVTAWNYDVKEKIFTAIEGNTILDKKVISKDDVVANLHPDDEKIFSDAMREIIYGKKERQSVEVRFRDNNDDKYRYIDTKLLASKDAQGNVTSVTGTQRDVTEGFLRRRQIEQSNIKYSLAIKASEILPWSFDVEKDTISLRFEDGKSEKEYLLESFFSLIQPENIDEVKDVFYHIRMGENRTFDIDVKYKSLTTREWCYGTFVCVPFTFDKAGKVTKYTGFRKDITRWKTLLTELQTAKEKAEQANKLKSAFLANMSHEIRTPLNAIVGFSGLLRGADSNEEREEYSNIIETNSDNILHLIDDILDLSKIEAGFVDVQEMQFSMSDLCTRLYNEYNSKTKQGVFLICQKHDEDLIVHGDMKRISQIMSNYLSNAIKFTNSGSVTMGYDVSGGVIKMYVADTGIGVAEENRDKIFDRFEKVNSFIPGTGLGLSIVKSIAEALDFEVGMEPNGSQGSVFWCKMKIDKEKKEEVEKCAQEGYEDEKDVEKTALSEVKEAEDVSAMEDKKWVLVAEDNQSNYFLVSTILKKEYNLIHVLNGEQAVEAVRNNDNISAVLLDIKMPVMDGFEATRNIRKFNTMLPIIALTAHAFESDHLLAMEAGCNDFMTKPIFKETLDKILNTYIK